MFDVTWLIWSADEKSQAILREAESDRRARAAVRAQPSSRVRLARLLRTLAARLDGAPAPDRRVLRAS